MMDTQSFIPIWVSAAKGSHFYVAECKYALPHIATPTLLSYRLGTISTLFLCSWIGEKG